MPTRIWAYQHSSIAAKCSAEAHEYVRTRPHLHSQTDTCVQHKLAARLFVQTCPEYNATRRGLFSVPDSGRMLNHAQERQLSTQPRLRCTGRSVRVGAGACSVLVARPSCLSTGEASGLLEALFVDALPAWLPIVSRHGLQGSAC